MSPTVPSTIRVGLSPLANPFEMPYRHTPIWTSTSCVILDSAKLKVKNNYPRVGQDGPSNVHLPSN